MFKKAFTFTLGHREYLYQFRLDFCIFWLFFTLLFCTLGNWQLHRYQAKKILLANYQTQLSENPRELNKDSQLIEFQRVTVTGHYDIEKTILLQNRFYHDQLGYEVITPFKITGEDKVLLIDRGWIPKKLELKELAVPGKSITLIGYIKFFDKHTFILGENTLSFEEQPIISQKIDQKEIEKNLQTNIYPFLLRLDENQPGAYKRDWIITNVIPQRHLGYAIQWFAMALAVVIGYFCFSIEKNRKRIS